MFLRKLYNSLRKAEIMDRIKYLRRRKEIPISKLTSLLKVSRATYYNYESGNSNANIDVYIKLADFYNVSLDYLCGRSIASTNDELYGNENAITSEDVENLELTLSKLKKMIE